MTAAGFRLITLGRIALITPDGAEDDSLGTRRRKLALLAALALANRPPSRELLLQMFWGDQDEQRARHSLSDALSHLRRALGRESVIARGNEVVLAPPAELRLVVDAIEMEGAVSAGDYERAAALYGGPFLSGLTVTSAALFEQWAGTHRSRLETLFLQSCEKGSMACARSRRWDECALLASRWLDLSPTSADAALYLLNALKAAGTREADQRALAEYRRLTALLERQHGRSPAPAVAELGESIARRLADSDGVGAATALGVGRGSEPEAEAPPISVITTSVAQLRPEPAADSTAIAPVPVAPQPIYIVPATTEEWRALRPQVAVLRSRSRRRRRLLSVAVGGLAFVAAVVALVLTRSDRDASAGTVLQRPAVAIMSVDATRADSAGGWLEEALTQMIAARLTRATGVEVVAPERVREIRARAQIEPGRAPPVERLLELGRRVWATWVVSGQLARGDTSLVLDLTIREAASGQLVRPVVVSGRDLLAVADAAAAAILAAAGASSTTPHLADAETANVEAYEAYARGMIAISAGRYGEAVREMDAAISRDSGFVSAVQRRLELAEGIYDTVVSRPLARRLGRDRDRLSEYERSRRELWVSRYELGERERAEALGRAFIARFPRDPRAYTELADIYAAHGRWDLAARTLRAELALDSLALEAGQGACAPCGALGGLAEVLWQSGDFAGAETAARRWVALQPDFSNAWTTLSGALWHTQRFDESLAAAQRAILLSGGVVARVHALAARVRIAQRDYAGADSAIRAIAARPGEDFRWHALDLRMTLERERGRLRASNAVTDTALLTVSDKTVFYLLRGNNLARLGDGTGAAAIYELVSDHRGLRPTIQFDAPQARGFVWHHVLLADAVASRGDTARLLALADSLELVSRRSYYGRDLHMADHVRGLVAMRGKRWADAARAFERALWIKAGWTRTNVELAHAQMALGRHQDAIATLRLAYAAPLDAMGRYVPRSELDYHMALAFERAQMADSAGVYATRVRESWRDADPEVRRLLDSLTVR